jgi:hypothetical protein
MSSIHSLLVVGTRLAQPLIMDTADAIAFIWLGLFKHGDDYARMRCWRGIVWQPP